MRDKIEIEEAARGQRRLNAGECDVRALAADVLVRLGASRVA
jgi:hypothetical protein